MNVKLSFRKGNLSKDVYVTQPGSSHLELVVKYAYFKDPFMD